MYMAKESSICFRLHVIMPSFLYFNIIEHGSFCTWSVQKVSELLK
jgi:hypothetical protein